MTSPARQSWFLRSREMIACARALNFAMRRLALLFGVVACSSSANSAPQPVAESRAPGSATREVVPAVTIAKLGDPAVNGRVLDVKLAAAVDNAPASDEPAYARADQ